MAKLDAVDEHGLLFKMEEGADGLPLAGIFWLHSREGQLGIDNEEIVPDPQPQVDVHVNTEPELEIVRSDTSPIPPLSLDYAALRRLIPSGVKPLTLIPILLPDEHSLEPIGANHWIQRVFNETYFRARPPKIGKLEREEAAFIKEVLSIDAGARLLDAGCGYGRLAIPLAELGMDVVAMDISVDMTSKTVDFAGEAGVRIDVREGDFRHCHYQEAFDAVVCADTTFGSFSDADNFATLLAFRDSLKTGGLLYLEVLNRDICLRELPGRTWWEGRGCLVQEDSEFVDATSHLKVKRLVVTAEGGQDEHWVQIRIFSAHELMGLLKIAGFKTVSVSGSFRTSGAFFASSSQKIIIVAEKVDN